MVAPLPLFQRLEITVLADLLTGTSVARMPAQTGLFATGDEADCFYVVLEGKVKLFALNEGGEESVVEVFEPVSSFAEAAMFASGSFPLSAEVMEDALLARVPAAPFMRKLRQDHRVAFTMLSNLALWHRRLMREKTSLRVKTPVQRVGGFLLSLTPAESGAGRRHPALPQEPRRQPLRDRTGELFPRDVAPAPAWDRHGGNGSQDRRRRGAAGVVRELLKPRTSFPSFPETEGTQPCVDLTKSIRLPLFRRPFAKDLSFLDEAPDTGRAMAVDHVELFRYVLVAVHAALMRKQWPASCGKSLDTVSIVSNAVVDVVGVLLFVAPV